jgi:hypothetical protein
MSDPVALRLVSDFREPYDHHFASSHRTDLPTWRRWSRTPRTRSDDHRLLLAAGLSIPRVGRLDSFPPGAVVVAYLDPCAHRGDGKRRETAAALLADGVLPWTYCTAWVGDLAGGVSIRVLGIGRMFWWLAYGTASPGEWRSNVGDVRVTLAHGYPTDDPRDAMSAVGRLQRMLGEPLVAVDFVCDEEGKPWAIDLATAPGVLPAVDLPSHVIGALRASERSTPRATDGLDRRIEKALAKLTRERDARLRLLDEEQVRQNVEDAAAWLTTRPTLVPLDEDTLENLETDAQQILDYVRARKREADAQALRDIDDADDLERMHARDRIPEGERLDTQELDS